MNQKNLQIYFFFAVLLAAFVLAFFIFQPYLGALILAATLAVVFRPLNNRLLYLVGGGPVRGLKPLKESLAALLTVVIVLGIVLLPLIFFGSLVFGEARQLYLHLTAGGTDNIFAQFLRRLQLLVAPFAPEATVDLNEYLKQVLTWLVGNLGSFFTSITVVLVNFFLSLFALYYFFKDGHKLEQILITYSPLSDTNDKQILNKLQVAVNSVITGALIVALVQGILAGLGFAFFGVPNPALWGTLTVFAALIPGIGTALVVIPSAVYLLVVGDAASAIGLLIWGLGGVATIDNFIRPKLIGRGIAIHPLIILLSVFGGIAFFGMIGFLIGPLTMSLVFTLLNIYKKDFRDSVV